MVPGASERRPVLPQAEFRPRSPPSTSTGPPARSVCRCGPWSCSLRAVVISAVTRDGGTVDRSRGWGQYTGRPRCLVGRPEAPNRLGTSSTVVPIRSAIANLARAWLVSTGGERRPIGSCRLAKIGEHTRAYDVRVGAEVPKQFNGHVAARVEQAKQ
jgi:hypothetical protein